MECQLNEVPVVKCSNVQDRSDPLASSGFITPRKDRTTYQTFGILDICERSGPVRVVFRTMHSGIGCASGLVCHNFQISIGVVK